jgi:ABC-type uncharacterized transport system permease subunit
MVMDTGGRRLGSEETGRVFGVGVLCWSAGRLQVKVMAVAGKLAGLAGGMMVMGSVPGVWTARQTVGGRSQLCIKAP